MTSRILHLVTRGKDLSRDLEHSVRLIEALEPLEREMPGVTREVLRVVREMRKRQEKR